MGVLRKCQGGDGAVGEVGERRAEGRGTSLSIKASKHLALSCYGNHWTMLARLRIAGIQRS